MALQAPCCLWCCWFGAGALLAATAPAGDPIACVTCAKRFTLCVQHPLCGNQCQRHCVCLHQGPAAACCCRLVAGRHVAAAARLDIQLRAVAFAHRCDDVWCADVDSDRMLLKGGCVIQLWFDPVCFECMCLQGPASLQGPHIGPVGLLLVPSYGAGAADVTSFDVHPFSLGTQTPTLSEHQSALAAVAAIT